RLPAPCRAKRPGEQNASSCHGPEVHSRPRRNSPLLARAANRLVREQCEKMRASMSLATQMLASAGWTATAFLLLGTSTLALGTSPAFGQETAEANAGDAIIVTGRAGTGERTKAETSYSVTNID